MAVSVTQTCRDVAELAPVAQTAIRLFFQECAKAGINVFVTETYRSQARQDYLYAQGRTRSGQIVTWTRSSRHSSRLAWDIAVCSPTPLYDTATLNKAGAIARKLGITWGGDWSGSIDRPHFEVKSTWKIPKGYTLGNVIVPSTSTGKVVFTVDDDKNEEANELAKTWNPQSPAMKTAAVEYLEKAAKDGIINNAHVNDLVSGSMTTDRLLGLFITIEERRQRK